MKTPPPTVVNAQFVASSTEQETLPAPLFAEVAFAGKSNVGKSSLINTLLARRNLAHTSSTPGRTRTLNLLRVEVKQGTFDLIDLPGYGYAKVSKAEKRSWGPMIENFLRMRAGLRAVVVIVDIRRGLQDDDRQLLEFLEAIDRRAILVATKLDKLASNQRDPALRALSQEAGLRVLPFSSVTRDGRDELWRVVLSATGLVPLPAPTAAPKPV